MQLINYEISYGPGFVRINRETNRLLTEIEFNKVIIAQLDSNSSNCLLINYFVSRYYEAKNTHAQV
jgi:hypothetical protein